MSAFLATAILAGGAFAAALALNSSHATGGQELSHQPEVMLKGSISKGLLTDTTSSDNELKIIAHRPGYPPVTKDARSLYGWDLIVDPHVPVVLRVTNTQTADSDQFSYTWSIDHLEGPSADTFEPIELTDQGPQIELELPSTADRFSLTVKEYDGSSTLTRLYSTETLVVKYVRREIKKFSDEDRNTYLDALETMYSLSQEEGEAKYGHDYISHAHLGALHGTREFKYHANTFFITSHPMFILKVEKSLLAIDKSIVLPYWDFMQDGELGGAWATSIIYSEDWFGTVNNGPEVDFRIQGRFHNTKLVYDPDSTMFPRANHGPYGFLKSGADKTSYVQRTSYNCGFYHKQGFATCDHLETCLNRFMDGTFSGLYEFDNCLEDQVHGTLHGMHGGMWDCPVDYKDYLEKNSDWLSEGRLSFMSLNAIVCQDILESDWLSCDTSCNLDDDDCGCTADSSANLSGADAIENIGHKHLYSLLESCLKDFYVTEFRGKTYMEKTDEGMYRWKDLTETQAYEFNKLLLKTVLKTYKYGPFNSGASTQDPLFFIMHQEFDRIVHLMRMSPTYSKGNFDWLPLYHSRGEGWLSKTPFDATLVEPYLGDHLMNKNGKLEKMTNKEIWAALKPDGVSSPYVYDELRHFGSCTFMGDDTVVEDD